MRKAAIWIGLIILALVGYGYWLYNKPHKDVAASSAEFQVDAAQLFHDFLDDETSANTRYSERIIEVRGVVSELDESNPEELILLLQASENQGFVSCGFDPEHREELKRINASSPVRVKGICKGLNGDADLDLLGEPEVVLSDCTIVGIN